MQKTDKAERVGFVLGSRFVAGKGLKAGGVRFIPEDEKELVHCLGAN